MTLTLDRDGERLDSALSRLVPELTRSQAQRLIEQGAVTQAGRPVKKNEKLPAGTALELEIPEVHETPIAAQDIPLEVCYEDADVIVVNKPKGLVVHPAPGHADGTLVNALLAHCGDSLSGIGGEKRPGIVHRIDKDTSGLIIAAKNDLAHAALAAQLKDHSLARTYVCIVCGTVRDDSGTIDAPIGRHPADRKKMAVTEKNSRSAVTHWRVLERFSGYTLVECKLETGRTHQIRVHMAYRGHPILGDMVYGHKKPELGQSSQCLHARELTFHELAAVPPCVYVRKGHPLTQLEHVSEADLEGYPYSSFEQAQGVAVDFSEELPMVSMRKPSKAIIVNNRSTAMNVLANTDAYSTGSGLLAEHLSPANVVTIPLADKDPVRLGWIYPQNAKLSSHAEEFVRLLEQSIQRSIAYTSSLHRQIVGK